jgi:lysophospholipase L1-like esterase
MTAAGSATLGRTRHLAAGALLAAIGGMIGPVHASSVQPWIGAWGFPPTSAAPSQGLPTRFSDVTVRQLVRVGASAKLIRFRFSNELGDRPILLGAARAALAADDGATVPGTDHLLTFAGRETFTLPAGAAVLTDPVEWTLPALATLAISSYVPMEVQSPAHRLSEYVASGNVGAAERMPGAELVRGGALVSQVEITSRSATRVVVTLGDSITEGVGSTANLFRGWPDRLAERLGRNAATQSWSVVNAGIGSNRLLHNEPGRNALSRFDRDVLSVPGVALVLVLEGINDIGYSLTTPAEAVSAEDITAAYLQLIARAHAHGLTIVAGTLPPFRDSHYYDAHGEQLRLAVNEWIRRSGAFDGVVDFDAALRDPADPLQLQASLHRGDHLHPNDAGYAAMAEAIDLRLFARRPLVQARR